MFSERKNQLFCGVLRFSVCAPLSAAKILKAAQNFVSQKRDRFISRFQRNVFSHSRGDVVIG